MTKLKNQSILVIDDDREVLVLLIRALEMEGYGVVTTGNGGLVLTLLEKYRPSLVLLDVRLPELSGFQVLNGIRQCSNVPVIMLSAKCEVTAVRDALALGADDYVRKPFRIRELLARIRAKLRRVECGSALRPWYPCDGSGQAGDELVTPFVNNNGTG